ncbi:MAG: YihY/virulence factor BrkB family protein [Ferruginibacter sp.]
MKLHLQIKNAGIALVNAYRVLIKNDPLRLAGATAFFTSFALPPILLLLIQLLSLLFNKRTISTQLFLQLGQIVGEDTVKLVVEILRGFRGLASNIPLAIGGFLFMIFVATTLFKVIQSSLNQVWGMRKTGDKRFKMALMTRFKSTLVILFTGLLFMATLAAESLKVIFGNYLDDIFPVAGFYMIGTLSTLVSIIIVSIWFTVLFRYLPDGKPNWRVAVTGGVLTSILYNIGVVVLKWLLLHGNIGAVYGASTSIVFLLLFLFYSSLIFYYGASFTKVWSEYLKQPIQPVKNAETYEQLKMKN